MMTSRMRGTLLEQRRVEVVHVLRTVCTLEEAVRCEGNSHAINGANEPIRSRLKQDRLELVCLQLGPLPGTTLVLGVPQEDIDIKHHNFT